MRYYYDINEVNELLHQLLVNHLDDQSAKWLEKQRNQYADSQKPIHFNLTFTAIPRFVNKKPLLTDQTIEAKLHKLCKGLNLTGWTTDRLARSWWLLQLPAEDKAEYVDRITTLFNAAEMNEQVALYGSLPLLAYPKAFVKQTAIGIRTNMQNVFDAIVLDNPYPSEYLEEAAWNQMVLKAIFMDRPINRITGLDKRANQKLAYILSDYAHERWAAGRTVNPLLWRPTGPFINEKIFPDIKKLFQSEDMKNKQAAALACYHSSYKPAEELLKEHKDLAAQIKKEELTWEKLG